MPITITPTPVTVVAGRTANHFGIGEVIDLTCAAAPAPPLPPIWRWSVTSGADRGHFSSNGNQARLILTALSGGTVVVKVEDRMNNTQATLTLTVVAPTAWSIGPPQYRFHLAGMAHAAFRGAVRVQNPSSVSFDNLEMREGNAMPERTGRYVDDNVNAGNHHGATFGLTDDWINIGAARQDATLQGAAGGAGYIALAIDRIGSHSWAAPFTKNGTFTWRIPWTYRLSIPAGDRVDVNGAAVQLPPAGTRQANNVITHTETLTGNSMTITKGGQTVTYTAAQAAVGNAAQFNA